jgi:hypothetical protein
MGRFVRLKPPTQKSQQRLAQTATFTIAATPVSSISEDLVFFYEDVISMLHEWTDSSPEFMSRGVRPRGPSGE